MDFQDVIARYLDGTGSSRYGRVETFPYFTRGEEWTPLKQSDRDDWISGFWPGIHWMAQKNGSRKIEDALELTHEVQPIHERNINTGFRYQYSWVPAYEATGNPKYKQKALEAARRLNDCFRPGLSLFCSRKDSSNTLRATNDALMNIPLLMWASEASPNGSKYRTTVQKFLERAQKLFVKENGAVRHRIVFDSSTLTPRAVQSPQGIPGGCWSRGLAWTVNGLTLGGLYLNRPDFLDTAQRIFGFHERNTYSKIPPFDYSVSSLKQPSLTDTSAEASMAPADDIGRAHL
jgi:unsaturated chondroitin disaccharide hydrolase